MTTLAARNQLLDEMRIHEATVRRVVAANLAAAGNATAIKLVKPDRDGCTVIYVHKSTRKKSYWQLTWCDWDGMPSGHTDHFKTRDEALRSASGEYVGEAPYGGTDYRVVETA